MKHLIATAIIVLFLVSCQKEMNVEPGIASNGLNLFFQNVKEQLSDSLSTSDYASLDRNKLFESKDAQSDGYFVRIAFQNKDITTDFVLLKTDSIGNIREGKIIHLNKTGDQKNGTNKISFGGEFLIGSLDRKVSVTKEVIAGRWKNKSNAASLLEEEPAGEQDLPPVVVTSYSDSGDDTGDWYWYGGFFDDYGGGGNYTYGYSGGGGSSAGSGADNTMIIEVESNNNPPIKIEDYIKCFSTVPDANATYKITIFSDIPVNGDPTKIFDWSTNSPGHSFIQLNKTNGNQTVQQNVGFYPEYGWKAPFNVSVVSKMVDNAGHEFNASLSQLLNGSQFQAALNKIQAIAGNDYNITSWNCTDFALAVFNAASSLQLTIPQFAIPTSVYPMPNNITYSNTPEGLFEQIQTLQTAHNTSYGTTDIPGVCGYVGNSHGSCK